VIEADDLPDVVAVGDSPDPAVAAGREGRNPVFIDDDSKSFEVVGSAEAARASGIEPKLRERRDAVRKAHGRRRLRWVALAVFVVLVVVAGLAVLGSSWFSIKEVDVGGAVYSRDELAPIIADIEGTPVLRLDTGGYEDRIREIPWVEDVRVTTHFPDRAKIEVRERVPVATFAGGDGRFRVIDREGRVLDMVDGQPADFLFVRSDEPPNTGLSDYAPPGFVGAASIATAFTPSVAPLVEVVEVANDGSDLRLALTGGTEVRLGDTQNLADKLVRLETVIDGRVGALPARIDVATSDVTTSESG
jgi:cell division protein FtsQ